MFVLSIYEAIRLNQEPKMGFKIPSPRALEYGHNRPATAQDFRIAFGKKNKLPDGAAPAVEVSGHLLFLKPRVPGHRAAHRVFCLCPTCQKEVPAGRTMQHKCKPVLQKFDLYWSPEGKRIATAIMAVDEGAARRKAPQPYRKYLGEIAVELHTTNPRL